ncbi:aspartyl protease family protein At5g10770-like [Tripterygium wilfordii]|uniref:aspartyl protease family protein At5g10770-like n=1 Tax=Tripterygium wilfordii TaxID=458696 RepID=UPI0018F857F0|nr:aspartyl protease family protein At5g10770-like [Tripterygium wilfordii]
MERHNFLLQLVLLCLLFRVKMCFSRANYHQAATGSAEQSKGIQITHRYSSTDNHQILLLDQDRIQSMNSIASNHKYNIDKNGEGTNLPLFGPPLGAGNYLVTVGFGTPRRDYKLIFDTGSDLTWMQCLPCPVCYDQDDQIFDPSKSSTFSNASCKVAASCDYNSTYGDKSFSRGYYARDTLTISPSEVFLNFVFGCGENNSKSFGKAAGLLGLGGEKGLSLMAQTSTSFAKIFCYCLPHSDSSTGYLLFGIQALKTCQTSNFTPLLSDAKRPYLYFVKLLGITIRNQRLKISSTNTILDSGTVITRLPPSVYSKLRSAFMKSMSGYPIAPPVLPLLSTCYNLEGYQNFTAPKMVLHFDKISVDLEPEAVIWVENNASQVCLAFAGNKDETELTIIGNHQQRMLNILFDINERKVEFGAGACGN